VIKSAFPKDGFLGEEFGEIKSKSGRRWIIDPIDGTKSFIHGVPMYGVMIGLEVEKFVQVGVVNFPALGEIFYAECGSGAYCNLQRITVSAIDTISDATLCITSEKNLRETDTLSPYTALKDRALLTRTWGDCYGHCLVAAGRAEIMIDPVMNPWDCAALVPIVEEAGGRCFDHHGEPTIYGKGFISTNAALAPVVMEQLKSTLAKPKRKI
ncbi:MAG: histidinol-phosphatase, partial [Rhizobacter sp.]|nr:histidinol-phosphatase [Chlorobiales bacterium]